MYGVFSLQVVMPYDQQYVTHIFMVINFQINQMKLMVLRSSYSELFQKSRAYNLEMPSKMTSIKNQSQK